jgi:hypothetical protein
MQLCFQQKYDFSLLVKCIIGFVFIEVIIQTYFPEMFGSDFGS